MRRRARRRSTAQARALDAFAIEGIRHNIPFLSALMEHPRWREGRLSTGFIAEEFPDGFKRRAAAGRRRARMAAVAAAIDHLLNERKRRISGQMRDPALRALRARARRDAGPRAARFRARGGATTSVAVRFSDGDAGPVPVATTGGRASRSGPARRRGGGNVPIAVQVRPLLNGFLLSHAGASAEARVYTRREAELAALMPEKAEAGTGKQLLCPMPGLVKAILVKAGQEVKVGEPLAIVEAMKMENVLRAERDATIATIHAEGRRSARGRRRDHGVWVTPLPA